MPLISVVIPVHNGERTIRETVNSVLNQTFADFELIVVDDGSQDSTLDILTLISDPRLKVIACAHAGANFCRNQGLFQATGDYISFLDADDLWTTDKLEAQLKALKANPNAAVAYSWTDRIDEFGNFLRRGGYISVSGNVLAELLIINFLENGSNPLILKEAAIAVGGFDESLLACQDWDMWLRLAARYEFVVVPSPQILYRVSQNSVSSNVLMLEVVCRRVINRAFAQAPASLQRLKRHSLSNIYKYLTFKAFERYADRPKSLAAARFIWNVIRNDPHMLRVRVTWKVLLNIAIVLFLSEQTVKSLLPSKSRLTDVSALLAHMKFNFSELI